MKLHRFLRTAFIVSLTLCVAKGMSVLPPTFADLVSRADTIAQTKVTAVRSEWRQTAQGRVIFTLISVEVESSIKGEPSKSLELVQLGGTVGDDRMEVADAPNWQVGDRDVLFVANNGKAMFPLLAVGYGRYPIFTDEVTKTEYMTRSSGEVLTSLRSIHEPMTVQKSSADGAEAALTLTAFKKAISQEMATQKQKQN